MYSVSKPSDRLAGRSSVAPLIGLILSGMCATAAPALLAGAALTPDPELAAALTGAAAACSAVPALAVLVLVARSWMAAAELQRKRNEGLMYAAASDRAFQARSARGDNRALEELEAALAV